MIFTFRSIQIVPGGFKIDSLKVCLKLVYWNGINPIRKPKKVLRNILWLGFTAQGRNWLIKNSMARLSIFRTENDAFRRYSNDNARESIESVITVSVKRERRVDSDYLVMRVTNRKRKKTHTILENI